MASARYINLHKLFITNFYLRVFVRTLSYIPCENNHPAQEVKQSPGFYAGLIRRKHIFFEGREDKNLCFVPAGIVGIRNMFPLDISGF